VRSPQSHEHKLRHRNRRRVIAEDERQALRERFHNRCAYCGDLLTGRVPWTRLVVEHVEPLSRGGEDVSDNYVAACAGCNTSKSDLLPLEWVLVRMGYWRTVGRGSGRHFSVLDVPRPRSQGNRYASPLYALMRESTGDAALSRTRKSASTTSRRKAWRERSH
jgi:hypothetical protein